MSRPRGPIAALLREVTERPDDALTGRSPAVRQLAALGRDAVGPVLRAMSAPTPPGQHPRDVLEALAAVLSAVAQRDPQPLVEALQEGAVPADPHLLLLGSALGAA